MVEPYDAVVVGAGPAGSATAAHLAASGARVLILDRSTFPRDKACGGGLTPRGVAALDRLGVDTTAEGFVRVGGLSLAAGDRRVTAPFAATRHWPSHGVVARRSVLDQHVLEVALARGAELRQARVLGPLMEDGICRGVRITSGTGGEDVRATVTVAADGATSAVARGAGLAGPASSGRGFWYAALRGYFTGVGPPSGGNGGPELEFYPLRAGGRWLPAYGWVFPLPGGVANVGVDLPHAPTLEGCPPPRRAYDDFVHRLRRERGGFEAAEPEAPPVGALLPEAMSGFRPGITGLLAVGDACGLITPYSGEGIAYALEGAELASRAIGAEGSQTGIVRRYAHELWDGYGFQFAWALRFMKAMRHAPLARAAATVGMRSPRVFRAAVRIMAYLVEEEPTTSTTSRLHHLGRRWLTPPVGTLWET